MKDMMTASVLHLSIALLCVGTLQDSLCPLNYPPKGEVYSDRDLSSLAASDTFARTVDFCRDYCLRYEPGCKSFNFDCSNVPSMRNCKLFNGTFDETYFLSFGGNHEICCCYHEDMVL